MDELKLKEKIKVLMLMMVISGFVGYIYEVIFYRIDLGYFVNRGTTFGPWIPIYAFGGLLIYFTTKKFKDKPLIVFLISFIMCGILEYIAGYYTLEVLHKRLWDYNVEIWNFGNINGFVCLRSVLLFGIGGVLLMKTIIPTILKLKEKLSKKVFDLISIIPFVLFLIDFILTR